MYTQNNNNNNNNNNSLHLNKFLNDSKKYLVNNLNNINDSSIINHLSSGRKRNPPSNANLSYHLI